MGRIHPRKRRGTTKAGKHTADRKDREASVGGGRKTGRGDFKSSATRRVLLGEPEIGESAFLKPRRPRSEKKPKGHYDLALQGNERFKKPVNMPDSARLVK